MRYIRYKATILAAKGSDIPVDKHVMEKTYKSKYALSCVLDCPQVE